MSNPQPPQSAQSPLPPQSRPSAQTTQAIPPVPPVPPASPAPPARTRGGLQMVTLIVAVLALVFGLSGVVIAALALGRSDKAATLAAEAGAVGTVVVQPTAVPPTGQATGQTTDEPTATDSPTDPTASTSPAEISPTAQFEVAYEGEKLRIRSYRCGYADTFTYVDLDEPRVGGGTETSEFGFADCDPGKIQTGLPFAEVSGASATPADCLETIRTDPGRSPIAPTRGLTLCFVTSQNSASAQGIRQKLVFVTIDSITVDNNTGVLNVTAKAWNVPQ